MKVLAVKQNIVAAKDVQLTFPPPDAGTRRVVYPLCATRLMASYLMRACTCKPASSHVKIEKDGRDYVAGNEPRYMLFFYSTALAKWFPVGVPNSLNWSCRKG